MSLLNVSSIESWHAHIYFDAANRDAAWAFRLAVEQRFGSHVQIGRFHERPVGPHPAWSSQIAFDAKHFAEVVPWLVLNHGALDLFVHPNTGDELRDHRDSAMWIGRSYTLDLAALANGG
ncbi:DOPA 4,5-dioxygenase family protein [Burkholderia guangdongensis]|uniref:DOPA 4,5-dioxygenase family protein n=1 Tax=Burkholderia guangdongensis TaxID=1792500 RepID=UPI0015CD83CE|nr:DOPA 4,5-dioxygenase family protein [Burkholderia guangdongensis]